MKSTVQTTVLVAGLCICVAPIVSDQAFAQTTQTETKYVTVDGDVVRYDAGRVIVIRGADNKEAAYTLSPKIAVPAEVRVGRRVTIYTEPGKDGKTQLVARVTTTSVTSEGNVKRTTEETRRLPSGATTRTTTTNISGKVEAYEAGRTLTITQSDGSKVTYLSTRGRRCPPTWWSAGPSLSDRWPTLRRTSPSQRRSRTSPRTTKTKTVRQN